MLLGWHDETQVFAAWDILAHNGQNSASPSAQIKEGTLQAASAGTFATQAKENEVVVAFRPFLLVDYAQARRILHQTGRAHRDIRVLNNLGSLGDDEIAAIANGERQTVVKQIARKYRAANFSGKVLQAYGQRCAFCRIQLGLLDAAHIVPVSAPGSTDEIVNGVALCKLHHFAYDSNLIAFDHRYKVSISSARVMELSDADLGGGLKGFSEALGAALHLPDNPKHHPNPAYVKSALRIRGWRP
ncbi:hypothetical protein BCO19218_05890 [Burkholderia contaminans]|nr:hypothetical protein BCO19218_05890 [Burkholderia contaminans]